MLQFFQTYIGVSGLVIIAGLVIAFVEFHGMDTVMGGEAAGSKAMGGVLGLVLAAVGAIVWFLVWLLEKI